VARTHPGAREIAFVDPRSDAQREEYMELRAQVIADLEAAGLDEAIPDVDQNMIALASNADLPSSVNAPLYTMGRMPQPMAVLTWEPGS
jgi:hypothetical protein